MISLKRDRWLAVVFAATVFVSAFLLFQVQPLVTKHILPWFGGSGAVWTTCMLFFQSALLAGYVYAHIAQRWLAGRGQVAGQLVLIAAAGAAVLWWGLLPGKSWQSVSGGQPVGRILGLLAASVGLPFFVLATTAPLVQAWYARSYPEGAPYRLYALSNVGSLLALLSYPFWFERWFEVPRQAQLWSWGFGVYAALCGVAAVQLWREDARGRVGLRREVDVAGGVDGESRSNECESRRDSPTWWQRAMWLLLPAAAVVALLATTNHVCTDIAAMPLLWVVPLALYLVTFIIAFDHPRWYRRTLLAAGTLVAIYGAALVSRGGPEVVGLYECGMTGRCLRLVAERWLPGVMPEFRVTVATFLAWNLAAMFGVCLLCHGELYRRRPSARWLTSFYLMLAAGGVLGGVAVTLVAPWLFRTYFEWRLVMFGGAGAAAAMVLHRLVHAALPMDAVGPSAARRGGTLVPLVGLAVVLVPTSLVMLDLIEYLQVSETGIKLRVRNFFGTLAVREKDDDAPERAQLFLYHGMTAHGSQYADAGRRGEPTTYYGSTSGVGRTLNFYRRRPELGSLRIGAVGLGTGTLAAYVGGGDAIVFYEINPAVIDLAESGEWFTYLRDCRQRGGMYRIESGDARLVLERELGGGRRQRYHVLVLDAFSGDAIPVHLLTEEAFDVYLRWLTTAATDGMDGALAVHTSNRYLELEPVIRGAAERYGLGMVCVHNRSDRRQGTYAAEWIVLTRNGQLLAELAPFADTVDGPLRAVIHWTDSGNSLWEVMK